MCRDDCWVICSVSSNFFPCVTPLEYMFVKTVYHVSKINSTGGPLLHVSEGGHCQLVKCLRVSESVYV